MSASTQAGGREQALRAGCAGVEPLHARLEPWQLDVCSQPALLAEWLELYGSPLNLIDPTPMARNAAELAAAAARFGVNFKVYFARKANKSLALVDEARRLGLGVDLASETELAQALGRGVPGSMLIMTAAVKPSRLLQLCITSGTTIAIDNRDELRRAASLAIDVGQGASVALRLAPTLGGGRPATRFGLALDEAIAVLDGGWPAALRIDGVHFHLDGYDPAERVGAVAEALALADRLLERGHRPTFVDVGGGIPMTYLDSASQWERFWGEHRRGLLGERPPLTFDGHGLGLTAHAGEVIGRAAVYPYHQSPTRGAWLQEVLAGAVEDGGRSSSVAEALRVRGLQLRCEPGRALLDGCGLTVARVVYRKRRPDGAWLIGVEMNRTQCRSTSEDFLVDPLLIRPDPGGLPEPDTTPTGAVEGYLVGAYCIERELLTWRRMTFPQGVAVGDLVVFPNTAGYLMHILESSSHQMPLARNLVLGPNGPPTLDPIESGCR